MPASLQPRLDHTHSKGHPGFPRERLTKDERQKIPRERLHPQVLRSNVFVEPAPSDTTTVANLSQSAWTRRWPTARSRSVMRSATPPKTRSSRQSAAASRPSGISSTPRPFLTKTAGTTYFPRHRLCPSYESIRETMVGLGVPIEFSRYMQ